MKYFLFIFIIMLASGCELNTKKEHQLVKKINTPGWEDSPFISLDGNRLYFMYSPINVKKWIDSNFTIHEKIGPDRYKNKTGTDTDIFISYKQENGSWGKPLGIEFNSDFDESCQMEVDDRKEIWYSSCAGKNEMDIFVIRKMNDGYWSGPENIGAPINTTGKAYTGFHECNPHFFNNTLYFEADHGYPGTDYFDGEALMFFGGSYDLFYSEKNSDGSWNMPQSMGPNINSKHNEMQAWIGIDGFTGKKVIYFNRYFLTGESYIFYSEFSNGNWKPSKKIKFGGVLVEGAAEVSLTRDGKYLYVVLMSDKTTLNHDIYYSQRQPDGTWSALLAVD